MSLSLLELSAADAADADALWPWDTDRWSDASDPVELGEDWAPVPGTFEVWLRDRLDDGELGLVGELYLHFDDGTDSGWSTGHIEELAPDASPSVTLSESDYCW